MYVHTYRKKPVEVQAVKATAENEDVISEFTGGQYHFVDPEDREGDDELMAEVWDKLHNTWVGVKEGQYIIKGVKGEFYPCDPEVFDETYDRVKTEEN